MPTIMAIDSTCYSKYLYIHEYCAVSYWARRLRIDARVSLRLLSGQVVPPRASNYLHHVGAQQFSKKTFLTTNSLEMTGKFGHVFTDGEDQYLYIKVIGSGADGIAQLVLHVQTGELVVRKVERLLLTQEQTQEEDPERILFSIQSQARQRGMQLNISYLQSADEVPTPPTRGQQLLYHRVKYFNFYNGGTFEDFWRACETRDLAPPPSLILTMIRDLTRALDFMYSMKPCFVFHGDIHWGNIFLHWDRNTSLGPRFFLGDFGRSTCGTTRISNHFSLVADVRRVWLNVCDMLNAGPNIRQQVELKRYLTGIVEPELNRLAHGPTSELPDFRHLFGLLSGAPAANPPDMRPFMLTRECQGILPSPLLYDTQDAAQKARGIFGPWHVGEVSINRPTGQPSILSVSPETYHRPYSIPGRYDTDSEGDDWASMV